MIDVSRSLSAARRAQRYSHCLGGLLPQQHQVLASVSLLSSSQGWVPHRAALLALVFRTCMDLALGQRSPRGGLPEPRTLAGIPSPSRRLSNPLLIVSVDSSATRPPPVPCKTRKTCRPPIVSAPQCGGMDGVPTGELGECGGTLASEMRVPPLPPPSHANQPLSPPEWPFLRIIQTVSVLGSFRFTEK